MSDLITYEELKSEYILFLFYVTDISEFLSLGVVIISFQSWSVWLQIIANFKYFILDFLTKLAICIDGQYL